MDDLALLLAAENGRTETVRLLLDRGADAYTRNDLALRWATKHGHTEAAAMLRAALTPHNAPLPPIPGPRRP